MTRPSGRRRHEIPTSGGTKSITTYGQPKWQRHSVGNAYSGGTQPPSAPNRGILPPAAHTPAVSSTPTRFVASSMRNAAGANAVTSTSAAPQVVGAITQRLTAPKQPGQAAPPTHNRQQPATLTTSHIVKATSDESLIGFEEQSQTRAAPFASGNTLPIQRPVAEPAYPRHTPQQWQAAQVVSQPARQLAVPRKQPVRQLVLPWELAARQLAVPREQPAWQPMHPAQFCPAANKTRAAPATLPLDQQQLVTSLDAEQFALELRHHPDRDFAESVLSDICQGVSLGYQGPRVSATSPNLQSASANPGVIYANLAKECTSGRIAGPYNTPPLPDLRCSGVGLVPKRSGGWRMITHLSAPPGGSINDYIQREEFSLQYCSIDDAIRLIQKHGQGTLMAKVDIKNAFRLLPVQRTDWHLLGIRWRGQFYVDKCLPFGLRSAPFLFNRVADAFAWILTNNYGVSDLIHYLDDFFTVGHHNSGHCQDHLTSIIRAAELLHIPLAPEKVEGPQSIMTFLGIELDSVQGLARLPQEKLEEIRHQLTTWGKRRKCTKRELLALIGKLSFAIKVVPAGRTFLRRLIDLSMTVHRMHHHITLTSLARKDIEWWQHFLPAWPGVALFLEPGWARAIDLNLFTDAAGAIGFGGYFQGAWFNGRWQTNQTLDTPGISIAWQELYAIVLAAAVWTP